MEVTFTKQIEPYQLTQEILASFPTAGVSFSGDVEIPDVNKNIVVDNTSATQQQIIDIITAHDYAAAVAAREDRKKDYTLQLSNIQVACLQALLDELRSKFSGTFTMTDEQYKTAVKNKLSP